MEINMMKTEKEFLAELDDNNWDLNIFENVGDKYPGLKVGLVGIFYFEQVEQNQKQAVWQAFLKYKEYYGQHLVKGYFDKVVTRDFNENNLQKLHDYISLDVDDACEFEWSSNLKNWKEYVGDYNVAAFLVPLWFEQTHKTLGSFRFYLPIHEIKKKEQILNFTHEISQLLRPLTGVFGLGMQRSFEDEFQPSEYEISQLFNGVDVQRKISPGADYRNEIFTFNWLTVLDDRFVRKLGGKERIREDFIGYTRIKVESYQHGIIIQAGDYPELARVSDNACPINYVAVNNLLKNIRTQNAKSMHNGSIQGELRLNTSRTQKWAERFDHCVIPEDFLKKLK